MAYNLRNISVLDLRPSTGVGVALPFSSPGVFKTVYTTKEQLKYNIINFLLTDKRERIFNPRFGAGIRQKLFEQISTNTIDDLDIQIRAGVEQYFPSVKIVTLTFGGDPDRNLLTIQFSYNINNTGESDNIILNLNG
jgi:phage baseplate assembly protein W|tara:strand:- start:341 stop:751 length:411 start_codon:yes stop_codon:yes gene_type:complete